MASNNRNIDILGIDDLKRVQKLELDALIEFDRICKLHSINYSLLGGTLLGAVRHKGFIPWDDDIDVGMLREDYDRFKTHIDELDPTYFYQSNETDKEYFRLYDKIRINGTVFKEAEYSSLNINHGVYIDIFPIDLIPNNNFKRKWQLLRFSFFNAILSSKALDISFRKGKKRVLAFVLRTVFFFFTKRFLYKKVTSIITKHNTSSYNIETRNFCGSIVKKGVLNKECFLNTQETEFENHLFSIMSHPEVYLSIAYGEYMILPPEEKRFSHHNLIELKL